MNNIATTTSKLTKKVILEELWKIKIDHSIQISEEELDMKIKLIFDDCQNMDISTFKAICKKARMNELYGKMPANYVFAESQVKTKLVPIQVKFNKFMNYEFSNRIKESDDEVVINLRTHNFKLQIDSDPILQNKIKEFFKNKEVKFTW